MDVFKNLSTLKEKKKEHEKFLIDNVSMFSKKVLYGIGESATSAINFFKEHNVVIDAIFDEDEAKNNTYYDRVLVTLPEYEDKDLAIVVTCSFYEEIRTKYLKYDKDIDKRLFIFDGYFREDFDIKFYEENKEKIYNAHNLLEDNKSKLVFNKMLEYRYVRNPHDLKDIIEPRVNGYFDEVFLNEFKQGVIVDAGSYKGFFVKDLETRKDISKSTFYLFEPSKIYSKYILDNLSDYNIKVFPVALCDINASMDFTSMPTSTSHILDKRYSAYKVQSDDVYKIKTYRLDDIIKDEEVTLIKVDIEGSEQAFLNGAIKTIKNNKPILLLSVYHKVSDLWELINYLDNLNLGYKFYLRHYSMSVAKTILYAI